MSQHIQAPFAQDGIFIHEFVGLSRDSRSPDAPEFRCPGGGGIWIVPRSPGPEIGRNGRGWARLLCAEALTLDRSPRYIVFPFGETLGEVVVFAQPS